MELRTPRVARQDLNGPMSTDMVRPGILKKPACEVTFRRDNGITDGVIVGSVVLWVKRSEGSCCWMKWWWWQQDVRVVKMWQQYGVRGENVTTRWCMLYEDVSLQLRQNGNVRGVTFGTTLNFGRFELRTVDVRCVKPVQWYVLLQLYVSYSYDMCWTDVLHNGTGCYTTAHAACMLLHCLFSAHSATIRCSCPLLIEIFFTYCCYSITSENLAFL